MVFVALIAALRLGQLGGYAITIEVCGTVISSATSIFVPDGGFGGAGTTIRFGGLSHSQCLRQGRVNRRDTTGVVVDASLQYFLAAFDFPFRVFRKSIDSRSVCLLALVPTFARSEFLIVTSFLPSSLIKEV